MENLIGKIVLNWTSKDGGISPGKTAGGWGRNSGHYSMKTESRSIGDRSKGCSISGA